MERERGNRIIGVVAAQSSAASLLPSVADFFMRPITRPCLPDLLPKLPRSCLSLDGANRANDSGVITSHRPEKRGGKMKPQIFMFAVLPRRSSHPLVYTASFLSSNRDALLTLINPAFIPSLDLSCLRPRVETGNEKAKPQTPLARLAGIFS